MSLARSEQSVAWELRGAWAAGRNGMCQPSMTTTAPLAAEGRMILKGVKVGLLSVEPTTPLNGNGIVKIGSTPLDRREVEELIEVLRELLR